MGWSCNFSLDESCSLLAQLISTALDLEELRILGQRGERIVKVAIVYAVRDHVDADGQGAIAKQGTVKLVAYKKLGEDEYGQPNYTETGIVIVEMVTDKVDEIWL